VLASRRRVDGVQVDATIHHERTVKFDSHTGLHPSHAGRAFVLDMADGRTLDLVARSDAEASEYVRGLRLLVADAVAKER